MIPPGASLDPLLVSASFLRLAQSWSTDSEALSRALLEMAARINRAVLDEMTRPVNGGTAPKPFPDPPQGAAALQAWWLEAATRNHRLLRDGHAAWSEWVTRYVNDAPGLDSDHRERCRFWSAQLVGALAPSNFFWANTGAVKRFIDTEGESLAKGYANWLSDQRQSSGMVSTVDRGCFEVGVDLAATPGAVVHRNRLMELIQYAPSTETVHRTPIVFVQPWINKYYILDLSPANSMIRWLRDQGFTVFSVSWKNPDASMREVGFDDYVLDGALTAVETARRIAGTETVHAVGFCIGGTALSALMAWLSSPAAGATDRATTCPVEHWTLLNSLVDFSSPGELRVFTGEEAVQWAEALMERDGFLDGRVTESVFRLLRSDSLIWHYAVRNYLYGDAPPKSDVLYWNSDSTRLTKRMLSCYLRDFYLNNRLVSEQGILMSGRRLRLGAIERPLYAVGCVQDHIAPWMQAFRVREHLRCPIRFALSSEGHVAGIVNPPSPRSRRRFWVGDVEPETAPEQWLAKREARQGSWWTDWAGWLADRCGPRRSPPGLGSQTHPVIGPAPGTYVFE